MKIGFFDSGIGGLSVLHYALKLLPNEQFLYYADAEHVPYGEKTREEITAYVDESVKFMIEQDAKVVVIACNTATSVAIKELRRKYSIPIIGMEPAVKKAIDLYGNAKVLVTATPVTVKGTKMKCLIERVDKQHLVELVPLPKLVRFAENGIFDTDEINKYLADEFKKYNMGEFSSIVLGCTHFNYFKNSFRTVLPERVHFIDGNKGTVSQLLRILKDMDLMENNEQQVDFYISGNRADNKEEIGKIKKLMERLDRMLIIS